MTVSIKRSFDQLGQPPKRLQCDPVEAVLHETPHLPSLILGQLTIKDLGSYSCASKGCYTFAQLAFIHKARELGYNPSDSVQAIEKIKSLFEYIMTLKERGEVINTKTTEQIARGFSRMTLSNIVKQMYQKRIYQNPAHPLLELLESKRSWEHAGVARNRNTRNKAIGALAFAAFYRRPLLVQRLLEHGTDPNRDIFAPHPEVACFLPRPLQTSILVEDMQSVQLLLEHRAVINVQDITEMEWIEDGFFEIPGMSVLQYALGSTHVKTYYPSARLSVPMIEYLIERGAEITNDDLVDAAETCSIEILQRLMHPFKRLHPDTANEAFGRVCAIYSHEFALNTPPHQMLEFLLNHGASLNRQNRRRDTGIGGDDMMPKESVLQYALGSNRVKNRYPSARLNVPMIEYLLERGAEITNDDLMDAAETCSIEILQRLMHPFKRLPPKTANDAFERICDIYCDAFALNTPLHQMLEFLLNHGASMNPNDAEHLYYTLNCACKTASTESFELIKFLVSKGADLSLIDPDVMTPLSNAVLSGDRIAVQFLLENKADVNQILISYENDPIRTALTYTCFTDDAGLEWYKPESNHIEMVKLLLAYGADPQPKGCKEGESPLELAKQNGLTKIVQLFEEHLASKAEGIL